MSLYRVTLRCHFTHYRGERRDVIKCEFFDAGSADEAERMAGWKAQQERYTVDGTQSVDRIDDTPAPRLAGGTR